jgi:hypothetical protein
MSNVNDPVDALFLAAQDCSEVHHRRSRHRRLLPEHRRRWSICRNCCNLETLVVAMLSAESLIPIFAAVSLLRSGWMANNDGGERFHSDASERVEGPKPAKTLNWSCSLAEPCDWKKVGRRSARRQFIYTFSQSVWVRKNECTDMLT